MPSIPSLLLLFDVTFERVEALLPEAPVLRDPVLRAGERRRIEPIHTALGDPAHFDDTGLAQHTQVLGDRRLGHTKVTGELARRLLSAREPVDDPSPGRIRQRLEDRHGVNTTIGL